MGETVASTDDTNVPSLRPKRNLKDPEACLDCGFCQQGIHEIGQASQGTPSLPSPIAL
ncbi:MAG: hypothetical protein QOC71_319 [Thermoplasmata archaeon]|nr:hypothetical protein [Thermoplasmata archaeon]